MKHIISSVVVLVFVFFAGMAFARGGGHVAVKGKPHINAPRLSIRQHKPKVRSYVALRCVHSRTCYGV